MKYEDIINLPHHQSSVRKRMPLSDRAAQFAPFAALTGHAAAIKETARLTSQRIELNEDAQAELNQKLNYIAGNVHKNQEIAVTYFKPDEKKDGGEYITLWGTVKKIDEFNKIILLADGAEIPINEIIQIFSENF